MTEAGAPACPRCGHPNEPGRWCNWCGALLRPDPPTDTDAEPSPPAPRTDATDRHATDRHAAAAAPSEVDADRTDGPAAPPPAPDDADHEGSAATGRRRPTWRATVVAIAAVTVSALAVSTLQPPASPPEGTRAQADGRVELARVTWTTDLLRHRPSQFVDERGRFEVTLTPTTAVLRIDDVVVEVDRDDGTTVERLVAPPDATTEPQLVIADSIRVVDPVGGDILRVIELPTDWYVFDERERGGRILVARRDPSGLSAFDNLAALDLVAGQLQVFEEEVPQALVGGTLTPQGARIAIVREFDRNGLYLDIEREAMSVGQIRLPTPESVVDADSLRVDATATTVAVTYERSFPGRPVATTLHVRGDDGTSWDAELPGEVPVTDVRLAQDEAGTLVLVRGADNVVTAWREGEPAWSAAGPPRLVPDDAVVLGPADGTVLVRNSGSIPWTLVALTDGEQTSTPVQYSDSVVATSLGFAYSRIDEVRLLADDSILLRQLPVTGRVTAGHGSMVAGTWRTGCDGVCLVDLATREVVMRTDHLAGRRHRWLLTDEHLVADATSGVVAVRTEDGELAVEVEAASLLGATGDGRLLVEQDDDGRAELAWVDLARGGLDRVGVPAGARLASGAFSGDVAVFPTALGLARVDRGGLRWETDLPGITAPPMIVGQDVVVATGRQLQRVDLETGEVIGTSTELPGVVWWTVPAGAAIVVGGDGFVAGLEVGEPTDD